MYSSIMRGQFLISSIFLRKRQILNLRHCYEHTRFRKKPPLGDRYLTDPSQAFSFNSWDNVVWDDQQEQQARENVDKNSTVTLTEAELLKYDEEADRYWDLFYDKHQNKFFKDRHWLFTEFPELAPNVTNVERVYPDNASDKQSALSTSSCNVPQEPGQKRTIFEIGCGVGNTIIPILKYSTEQSLQVYGCDFSSNAINILRQHEDYDPKRCEVFVLDATADEWNVPFAENSIDVIVLIFVLSSVHPDKMQHVANQCFKYLKPGGIVVLRDYGRYDLAQLRFKPGKCLQENFYVRGDGTRVYFFTQDELRHLFESAGLTEQQNIVDRRLQVNRGKMVKMYRVWIQTKYCKKC